MTLSFTIDPTSSDAPFEQVRARIAEAAKTGLVPPGSKLPTVRQLAAELDVAVNTVAKSYRALERDGVIETRGRSGSFVAATGEPAERLAHAASLDYVRRMRELDVDLDDALSLVTSAYAALGGRDT